MMTSYRRQIENTSRLLRVDIPPAHAQRHSSANGVSVERSCGVFLILVSLFCQKTTQYKHQKQMRRKRKKKQNVYAPHHTNETVLYL